MTVQRLSFAGMVGRTQDTSGSSHKPGYLSQMRAWQPSDTAEVLKLNLIEELGFADDQVEILLTLQELHSDGSLSPVKNSDGINLSGDYPEAGPQQAEADNSKNIFLASIGEIQRTSWTEESIAQALQDFSLYDYQHQGVGHLLLRNSALLADDMGLGKTRQAIVAAQSHGSRPRCCSMRSSALNVALAVDDVFAVDLLFKVGPGQYRLYVAGQDPAPIRELVKGDAVQQIEQGGEQEVESDLSESEAEPGSSEFLLEKDLQRYLAENLSIIEHELRLYVDEDGVRGIEYDADGRRIDILAVDRDNNLCVIELKVSKG